MVTQDMGSDGDCGNPSASTADRILSATAAAPSRFVSTSTATNSSPP